MMGSLISLIDKLVLVGACLACFVYFEYRSVDVAQSKMQSSFTFFRARLVLRFG